MSLSGAGWTLDSNAIMFDPDSDGCYRNWRRLAEWLLTDPADYCLICEDDIELSRNLRAHLESIELPKGVVSLYTGAINHHDAPGWYRVEKLPKHCHGALATVWTPELLKGFLEYDRSDEFANGTDTHIGMWCKRNKVDYWCHSPSFVRHTGVTSAIDPSWDETNPQWRQCKEWISEV